jgi:hypothetical protein
MVDLGPDDQGRRQLTTDSRSTHQAGRQSHVPDDERVCRVRAFDDCGAGALGCRQGQGNGHQERESLWPPPAQTSSQNSESVTFCSRRRLPILVGWDAHVTRRRHGGSLRISGKVVTDSGSWGECGGDGIELRVQVGTYRCDRGDDSNCDQCGDQAVFDGRNAGFVLGKTQEEGVHVWLPCLVCRW